MTGFKRWLNFFNRERKCIIKKVIRKKRLVLVAFFAVTLKKTKPAQPWSLLQGLSWESQEQQGTEHWEARPGPSLLSGRMTAWIPTPATAKAVRLATWVPGGLQQGVYPSSCGFLACPVRILPSFKRLLERATHMSELCVHTRGWWWFSNLATDHLGSF